MNWNFIKTNWFSIALVLLILAAMIRGVGLHSLQGYFIGTGYNLPPMAASNRTETTLGLGVEPTVHHALHQEVDQATAAAFLKRFSAVAVSERKKFGVPASVLLAAAFLNSHVGLDVATSEANNFFAIPCTGEWEGESVSIGDQCLRKYETPWASWRDFSIYLSSQEWFGSLRQSAGKDWHKWAKGMNHKNMSPISNFGQKLTEVIGYYRLYELDQP